MLINDLFHQIGMILKEVGNCTEDLLDSFPVPICDNIRIFHSSTLTNSLNNNFAALALMRDRTNRTGRPAAFSASN